MLRLGYNSNGFAHHRLDDALMLLADLGYQAVAITPDVGCLDPRETGFQDLRKLGGRLSELGLEPVLETGARFLLDPRRKHRPNLLEADESHAVRLGFLRKMVEWANLIGASVMSFWSGVLPEGQTEEGARERFRAAVETLAELAEKRGVTLALEPEPGHWVATLADWRAARELCPDRLRLMLDVGHLLVGEDPAPHDALHQWSHEIAGLQLDDMRRGEHRHLPPGEGALDWEALAAAIAETGLSCTACWELGRDSHRFPELAREALDFWRALQPA